MSIYDVVSSVNGIPNEIRPLDMERDIDKYHDEENLQQVLDYIKAAGGTGHILVTDSEMFNIYYAEEENGVYFDLFNCTVEYLDMSFFEKRLPVMRQTQYEHMEEGNWLMYFFPMPNAMKMYAFEHIYRDIPTEEVTEAFFNIYTDVDYNVSLVKPEVFDYVCEHAKRKPGNKKVTIYRGEGTKSRIWQEAFSWTTDINTAIWFATKGGAGRAVYKAKVSRSDIIFSTNERNEHEIIVRPEDVQDVENLGMYSCEDDMVQSFAGPYIGLCQASADILRELYPAGEKIGEYHTISHVSRVLLLTFMIAEELGMSDEDKALSAIAAMYHDCGRTHDGIDAGHGKLSAEVFGNTLTASNMTPEDAAIVYRAIEYHSREDKDGLNAIEADKRITNKKRAIRIYKLLKDADALDRFRLGRAGYGGGAFEYKYLRFKESKSYTLMAAFLCMMRVEDVILQ